MSLSPQQFRAIVKWLVYIAMAMSVSYLVDNIWARPLGWPWTVYFAVTIPINLVIFTFVSSMFDSLVDQGD